MIEQSASSTQKNFIFFKSKSSNLSINGRPSYLYKETGSNLDTQWTFSEYRYQEPLSDWTTSFLYLEDESILLSDKSRFSGRDKESLGILENKIYNIYLEHQDKDWDGYCAEPIQYLNQSLQFAKDLFFESRVLIESVEIVPENDGCLCFEWHQSSSKFINISVKNDKLIYTYKFGEEKACGETTYSGKQMLIEQIKKII